LLGAEALSVSGQAAGEDERKVFDEQSVHLSHEGYVL